MLSITAVEAFHDTSPQGEITSAWAQAESQLLAGFELNELTKGCWNAEVTSTYQNDLGQALACSLARKGEEALLWNSIDTLVRRLSAYEIGTYRDLGFTGNVSLDERLSGNLVVGDFNVKLTFAGAGSFGAVYKLTDCHTGRSYALKTFYKRNAEHSHSGPWSETALGIYTSAQSVANMPRLCAANPSAGWTLCEFVDRDYVNPNFSGPTWSELGLINLDPQKDGENQIRNKYDEEFRVDFGHLTSSQRQHQIIPEELLALLERKDQEQFLGIQDYLDLFEMYPEERHFLVSNLALVAPHSRLFALSQVLNLEGARFFPVQDFIKSGVIDPKDTTKVFNILMSQNDPQARAQAVFDIRELSQEDICYLFREWHKHGEFKPFLLYLRSLAK